jgi:hypothetical protein
VEEFEARCVPATFNVSFVGDMGIEDPRFRNASWGDLRYCIGQANASQDSSSTILLGIPAGTYNGVTVPALNAGTITLGSSLPSLTKSITIVPNYINPNIQGNQWTISGNSQVGPLLSTTGGSSEFDNFDMGYGSQANGSNGGGITNQATLAINNCNIYQCTSVNGGGIYNDFGKTLTLSNCSISECTATQNGGGIYNNCGTVTCNAATSITSNQATGTSGAAPSTGLGGGIYSTGSLNLSQSCSVNWNQAQSCGGGIYNDGSNSSVTMSGGSLDYNIASNNSGGGIAIVAGTVTMSSIQIADNQANNATGGGFYLLSGSLTLNTCSLFDNSAQTGPGGWWNSGQSTLTINGGNISDTIVKL